MIRIGELFAGVGTPRMAFRDLEIDILSKIAIEIDEKAVLSYNNIFNDNIKPQDIREIETLPNLDVLFHGSPCVDFSLIGNQKGGEKGSGTQSSLLWETIRLIENSEEKPKVVVWENVRNVLNKRHIGVFKKYLDYMEELGYHNEYKLMDSQDYGLPQIRKRVFAISTLTKPFNFDNIKEEAPKEKATDLLYWGDVGEEHIIRAPGMVKRILKNDTYARGLQELGDVSLTVTTKQDGVPNAGIVRYDKERWRLLTEREVWRLMGFSDRDYEKALEANPKRKGFKSVALYKQAGNAMALPLMKKIVHEIVNGGYLEEIEE